MIVIEDLMVANQSKSAVGTVSQSGRNIRAKSGLNRSILVQGFYELRRQLEYNQGWLGGQVLTINPAYTSQECEYTENADINGVCHILAAGRMSKPS